MVVESRYSHNALHNFREKKYIFHTRLGPFTSSPDNNTFTVSGVNKPFTAETSNTNAGPFIERETGEASASHSTEFVAQKNDKRTDSVNDNEDDYKRPRV